MDSFSAALGRADAVGVQVKGVVEDTTAPRMRYEPSHPDADDQGFVAMPNVDVPEEMVNMLGAARGTLTRARRLDGRKGGRGEVPLPPRSPLVSPQDHPAEGTTERRRSSMMLRAFA